MGINTEQDYIEHVTKLGDSHTIQTSEDIYSHSGVKLVDKGVQINKGFYEDLVKHKLLKPIDFSLKVENCITTTDLYKEAKKLIDEVPWLNMVVKSMHDQDLPLRILSAIDLAPPLAFKLTVARERSPQVFEHCIEVALISICLGEHASLGRQALKDIAAAGVFHDLGILHINHELLDPERKLTEQDKQSLFAHPLISYLILKEFPQYHPSVSKAVLDHHERMNGSGYPRGIKNDEISEFGEILAIAELVISFINKNPGVQMQDKLNIILKFNRHNYSVKFTHYLINIFKSIPSIEIEKDYSSFDMSRMSFIKVNKRSIFRLATSSIIVA